MTADGELTRQKTAGLSFAFFPLFFFFPSLLPPPPSNFLGAARLGTHASACLRAPACVLPVPRAAGGDLTAEKTPLTLPRSRGPPQPCLALGTLTVQPALPPRLCPRGQANHAFWGTAASARGGGLGVTGGPSGRESRHRSPSRALGKDVRCCTSPAHFSRASAKASSGFSAAPLGGTGRLQDPPRAGGSQHPLGGCGCTGRVGARQSSREGSLQPSH